MTTAITNVRIFDGDGVSTERTVVLEDARIAAVGGPVPPDATVVDGDGGTLLPGLIDSHVHTDVAGLRDALAFGVTTELEMQGHWSQKARRTVENRDDVADLRTSGMGVDAEGWASVRVHHREWPADPPRLPVAPVGEDARRRPRGSSRSRWRTAPTTSRSSSRTAPRSAIPDSPSSSSRSCSLRSTPLTSTGCSRSRTSPRRRGAGRAIAAGVDGLAHLFLDAASPGLIDAIAASGAFVVPTLVTLSTAFGHSASELAVDPRVRSRAQPAVARLAEPQHERLPAG